MPRLMSKMEAQPKVIVVGAGFGGIYVAKGLIKSNAQITIIDRHM